MKIKGPKNFLCGFAAKNTFWSWSGYHLEPSQILGWIRHRLVPVNSYLGLYRKSFVLTWARLHRYIIRLLRYQINPF